MLVRTFVYLVFLAGGAATAFAQNPVTVELEKGKLAFFESGVKSVFGLDVANDGAIQTVKAALNLSDVQVNALKTLLTQRAQNMEQIAESMSESHRKLEDVLSQTNPNPTEVGVALLAARGSEAQMKSADQKFQTDFRSLLSPDQRSALEKLSGSSASISGLQALGILEGGNPGVHAFMHVSEPDNAPFGVVTSHAIRIEHH